MVVGSGGVETCRDWESGPVAMCQGKGIGACRE